MATTANEVYAIAAVVWDQDTHNDADMAFLDAVAAADKEWSEALSAANINFGAGSEAWHAVKRLATKTREVALVRALAELESHDDEYFGLLQAAE